MLGISICQLGFPVAISKLVAEEKRRSKSLILGLIPICFLLDIILMFAFLLLAPFISHTLLHEKRCMYAIMGIGFVLPFISISSLLRGYFFGKEKMMLHVFTNLVEDIVRIIVLLFFLPMFVNISLEVAVLFLVLSNIFSELTSIFIFLLFIPKSGIQKEDFILKKNDLHDVFSIGLPITGSRLIGNIGGFLEPILITYCLSLNGLDNSFIVEEYGILNGFVMPIILLPSFFSMAISQAIVPQVSKSYVNHRYFHCKKKIKQACFLSLTFGILFTLFILIHPTFLLQLLYQTSEGTAYLRVLAVVFLVYYLQGVISSSLHAIGKSHVSMKATLLSTILRMVCICLFSSFKIGMWSVVVALSVSITVSTFYEAYMLKKSF
jgi:stage V sporulation protein B